MFTLRENGYAVSLYANSVFEFQLPRVFYPVTCLSFRAHGVPLFRVIAVIQSNFQLPQPAVAASVIVPSAPAPFRERPNGLRARTAQL